MPSPSELYYSIARETILYQSALIREHADRAFNILNLGVATLAAGSVIVNLRIDDLDWNSGLIIAASFSILSFFALLVLCIDAMITPRWQGFPSLHELGAETGDNGTDETALLSGLQEYFRQATHENAQVVERKATSIFLAALMLTVEITSVLLGVFVIFLAA